MRGPGSFSKIGTRNAMVIAVAGLCLVIDEDRRRVNVALGSVGPTILRATQAEERVAAALTTSGGWDDRSVPLNEQSIDEFAELVAGAAQPLDDVRGTAAYRRHGCRVLARRAIGWALSERRLPAWL
jgi:CO/xanthine dehydrogenase FAD-binding subunit